MTNIEREFVGYFFGEGTVGVYLYKTKRTVSNKIKEVSYFRPLIKITARDDDAEMLRIAHRLFGGYLYERKKTHIQKDGYKSNPSVQWTLSSVSGVRKIVKLLEKAEMPSKKKELLPSMNEFLNIADGHRYSKEQRSRIEQIICEQKYIRSYNFKVSNK